MKAYFVILNTEPHEFFGTRHYFDSIEKVKDFIFKHNTRCYKRDTNEEVTRNYVDENMELNYIITIRAIIENETLFGVKVDSLPVYYHFCEIEIK